MGEKSGKRENILSHKGASPKEKREMDSGSGSKRSEGCQSSWVASNAQGVQESPDKIYILTGALSN
jgi:hypothetical protein